MRNRKSFGIVVVLLVLLLAVRHFHHRKELYWRLRFEPSENNGAILFVEGGVLRENRALVPVNLSGFAISTSVVVTIDSPRVHLPAGEITFADLTEPPGRVHLKLNEHQVEIMQRTLVVDKREVGWPILEEATLKRTNKP